MKLAAQSIALFILLFVCRPGHPAQQPDELIKATVADVLAAYEQGKDSPDADPNYLRGIIEQHVMPHVDVVLMSKLVLGKHWRKANDEQRDRFTDGFREMLIRTYTKPLSEYSGQTVSFLPYHEGKDPNRASVNTAITLSDGALLPVSYRLRFKEQDGWKVYDISIDGISVVANYRSAFASEIARSGLDEVLSSLAKEREGSRAEPTEGASALIPRC